jgi:hypothetical protein
MEFTCETFDLELEELDVVDCVHDIAIIDGMISARIRQFISPDFRGFAWDPRLIVRYP